MNPFVFWWRQFFELPLYKLTISHITGDVYVVVIKGHKVGLELTCRPKDIYSYQPPDYVKKHFIETRHVKRESLDPRPTVTTN